MVNISILCSERMNSCGPLFEGLNLTKDCASKKDLESASFTLFGFALSTTGYYGTKSPLCATARRRARRLGAAAAAAAAEAEAEAVASAGRAASGDA